MLRRLTAVGATFGVLFFAASSAHAQAAAGAAFGNQGEFIISADRLFPAFGFTRASANEPGNLPPGVSKIVDTDTQTNLGLFWGSTEGFATGFINGGNGAIVAVPNVFTVPRVGFDYTIVDHVTIGGDIALMFTLGGSSSRETDFNNGNVQTNTTNEPTTTVFGIAPRGGYVLGLNDTFSLWLRGGFSYYTVTVKQSQTDQNNNTTTTSVNFNQFALDLDPQLVITPLPHFGFNVGLTADIPLAGGHSVEVDTNGGSTSASAGSSLMFIGATAGILGWFGP